MATTNEILAIGTSDDVYALRYISKMENKKIKLQEEINKTPVGSLKYNLIMNQLVMLEYNIGMERMVWCW